jgi:hypothetical protein
MAVAAEAGSPPTPDASALAKQADPDGKIFRVAPGGGVLHVQSGMVCVLGGDAMLLQKLLVGEGAPPGDHVECEYATPNGAMSVGASRLAGEAFDAAAGRTFGALRSRFGNGRDARAPAYATYPGLGAPKTQAIAFQTRDGERIVSAWVSQERGWLVVVEAQYPAAARHDSELFASMASINAQKTIHDSAGP